MSTAGAATGTYILLYQLLDSKFYAIAGLNNGYHGWPDDSGPVCT